MPKKLLQNSVILLFFVLILTACGNDEQDTKVSYVSRSDDQPIPAEISVKSVSVNDTDVDFGGHRLVAVHGGSVEIMDMVNPKIRFGENIVPSTIKVLSDRIFYTAGTGRYHYYTVDFETYEPQSLSRVSGEYAFFSGLSPDQQWVLVSNPIDGFIVVRMDGSGTRYKVSSFPDVAFWLADNTLLIVTFDVPRTYIGTPASAIQSLHIYDPMTQETTELEIGTMALMESFKVQDFINYIAYPKLFIDFATFLNDILPVPIFGIPSIPDQGLVVATSLAPPTEDSGVAIPQPCAEWAIERLMPDGSQETVYTAVDTFSLNNPEELFDGSIAFERWYFDSCNLTKHSAELLLLRPNGELSVITNTLDPSESQNYNFFFSDLGARTAVSPDGRYIAWIGGGMEAGYSSLNLYDVSQNVNIELEYIQRDASNSTNFHITEAFQAVAWLPAS